MIEFLCRLQQANDDIRAIMISNSILCQLARSITSLFSWSLSALFN